MPKILIVNKEDRVIGAESKKTARSKGLIHRIVRIFLFNSTGQIFLQKRSSNMDIDPNLWDQSAGGHVDEGENYYEAAIRETSEELGIKETFKLEKVTKFYHEESLESLVLKRFNLIYKVIYDGKLMVGKDEVAKGKWLDVKMLEKWMKKKPDDFCTGFLKAYQEYRKRRFL